MDKNNENKKEYKIKKIYLINLDNFYKKILKNDNLKDRNNDSKY